MVSSLEKICKLVGKLTLKVHWDAEEEEETRPLTRGEQVLGASDSDHLPVDEEDHLIIQ